MKTKIITAIVVLITGVAAYSTVQALQSDPAAVQKPQAEAAQQNDPFDPIHSVIEKTVEKQGAESAQEPSEKVEMYQQPSQAAAQPAPAQESAQPVKNEAGGHIPFTNKPVTAGDPQSYVDTVGQCPFYEMAGEKGCMPPPDIECNADWSICKLKETNQ